MKFAPEYVTFVLNENFEDAKALLLSPMMAINYAHLVMLAAQGIVSPSDAHALREALDGVSQDAIRDVKYDGTYEDLFFYVERLIVQACGEDVAGRLHTARSRNDIDMTMYRMRQREFVLGCWPPRSSCAARCSTSSTAIATRFSRFTRTRSGPSRRPSPTTSWRSSNSSSAMPRGSKAPTSARIAIRSAPAPSPARGFPSTGS
jgi:hypothetical protein